MEAEDIKQNSSSCWLGQVLRMLHYFTFRQSYEPQYPKSGYVTTADRTMGE